MMKHLVDHNGNFIGSFDETQADLPPGLIQVPSPPPARGAIWTGTDWEIPASALSGMKDEATRRVIAACDDAARAIIGQYSDAERLSFAAKEQEAVAWSANNTAATPTIDAEIAENGQAKPDRVAQILAKAAKFRALAGALAGIRSRHQAEIAAATTPDEITAALAAAEQAARNAVAAALA